MADDITQVIADARIDAVSLSDFMNKDKTALVDRRLAPDIRSMDWFIDQLETTLTKSIKANIKAGQLNTDELTVGNKMEDSVLFIGDSLTEGNATLTSYTKSLIKRMAPMYGGIKQFGYLPLTTAHTKMMGYDNQISISRTAATVVHMWGTSDHKWEQSPYKYSPDGKGFMCEASNNEQIYINTKGLIKATKIRLYYLKQPNGCKFSFGYSGQPAAERILIDTQSATEQLATIEIDTKHISERIIIALDGLGKKFAVYGVEFIDDSRQGGLTYNTFARAGAMLQEFNQLTELETYYALIKPTIIVINIGVNDALQDFSRLPAAQFKTQLQTWVNRVRSVLPNTAIYIVEPNRSGTYGTDKAGDGEGLLLAEYTPKRKEVADENENVRYIDIPLIMGGYDHFVEQGWMQDALHINELGKSKVAAATLDYLLSYHDNYSYDTVIPVVQQEVRVTALHGKQTIGGTWTTIATYGIKGNSMSVFFDLKASLSFSGKQWVGELKAYALKTNQADGKILDVRGSTHSEIFRYDAGNSTTHIELQMVKNAAGYAELQVRLVSNNNSTANEWTISGTVSAATQDYLVEL